MNTQLSPRRSPLDAMALTIDPWLVTIGRALGRLGRVFLRVGPLRAALDGLIVNGIALLLVWFLDPPGGAHTPAWLTYPVILDIFLVSSLRLRMPANAP